MLKKILLLTVCAVLMACFEGCISQKPRKMLSEDIEILTVFAKEISVLKNSSLRPNSKEKYEAARRLAEGVDFSLTRSVETLTQIFDANDAMTTKSVEFGEEIAFYYNYQNNFVRFRFWRTRNAVTDSEVRIK